MKSFAVAIAMGVAALYVVESLRYGVGVLKWLPRHERWARGTKGLCPNCGYDLTGNISRTCPECGAKVGGLDEPADVAPRLVSERRPWWVWAVVVATMLLAVIVQRLFWV